MKLKFLHSGTAVVSASIFSITVNLVCTVLNLLEHRWVTAGITSLLLLAAVVSYWLAHWFSGYGQLLYDNALLDRKKGEVALGIREAMEATMRDVKEMIGQQHADETKH